MNKIKLYLLILSIMDGMVINELVDPTCSTTCIIIKYLIITAPTSDHTRHDDYQI